MSVGFGQISVLSFIYKQLYHNMVVKLDYEINGVTLYINCSGIMLFPRC